MTGGAPDAFNSGAGLVLIELGAEHAASWRIHAIERRDTRLATEF